MILVDTKEKPDKYGRSLLGSLHKLDIPCEPYNLPFGDLAFSGNGPEGACDIGIERKRVQDMLDCIDSKRLTGHQLVGMRDMFRFRFVIMEGFWKPDPSTGLLMEGHARKDGHIWWSSDRAGGRYPVKYAKLRRFLYSLSLMGCIVLYTRDVEHTAYDAVELYKYFQKRWKEHRASMELPEGYDLGGGLAALPTLGERPSLARRWAAELPGIGATLSSAVARRFPLAFDIAMAGEDEWLEIPGVGDKTARDIVNEIMGR